jgi:predicted AlkP superfamily phosphohydrolase/phosphomutase
MSFLFANLCTQNLISPFQGKVEILADREAVPTAVIGLDGATFDVIDRLVPEGKLPNLQKAMSTGARATLLSSTPPLSAIAWTTVTTGVNPGKHGIFDFAHRSKESYDFVAHTARDKKSPSIWKMLGEAGKKSCIVNVPLTYPAERLNGVMLSGFPFPPGAKDVAYPSTLPKELEREVGSIDFSKPGGLIRDGQEKELVDEIEEKTDRQLRVIDYLLRRDRYDFFMTVFDGIDVVSHSLWKFIDPNHPKYDPDRAREAGEQFYRAYEICDSAVGKIGTMLGEDVNTLVISDHGNGPVYYGVYVNNWLADSGYLRFNRGARTWVKRWMFRRGLNVYNIFRLASLLRILPGFEEAYSSRSLALGLVKRLALSFDDIDWDRTRVYSFGNYGQLFVNLKGREPRGIVEPGAEEEILLKELVEGVKKLKDEETQRSIFDQVYLGSELYKGPCEIDGPDVLFFDKNMVYTPHRIFELATNKLVTPHPLYSGNHKAEGILIASGPGVSRVSANTSFSIEDVTPSVLGLLGVAVDDVLDGKPFTEILQVSPKAKRAGAGQAKKESQKAPSPFTEGESEELAKRLKDLGYI